MCADLAGAAWTQACGCPVTCPGQKRLHQRDNIWFQPTSVSYPRHQALANIAGGESLFQLSTGNTFIFETRLEFIDVDQFFGSAYFLERIQYDQEDDVRFIGDAYFETQLIEQAILDQTGERFLDETTNTATEQFLCSC